MNTPERISKLSAAILDMAEQNRGLIKSELDELIYQHCAAADVSSGPKDQTNLLVAMQNAMREMSERVIYPPPTRNRLTDP